jgi:putative tributyrin esterase
MTEGTVPLRFFLKPWSSFMIARTLRASALLLLLAPSTSPAQPPSSLPAVKTVEFEAKSVGRTMKYNVVLPESYENSKGSYPVLYLLHGYSGNYTNWARHKAPEYARAYDLIVVMPDAGNSWYANWARSDEDQKNNWEDVIIKDLIGHVDSTYRTIASRDGRAINGLSMGGYGALMLGLKHPDLFCAIGSHSGAIGYARSIGERLRKGEDSAKGRGNRTPSSEPNPAIGIEGFNSQVERSPKGKVFTTPEEADAYDPFKLVVAVPKEKLPHIYVDCGTEDGLLKSSQEFVKVLMENKIPFTYAESAGGHNGAYWSREVGHSMAVQYQILRRNLAKGAADAKKEAS